MLHLPNPVKRTALEENKMTEAIFNKVLRYMNKNPAQEAFDLMSARYQDEDIFLVVTRKDKRYKPMAFFGPPKDFSRIIGENEVWYWTHWAEPAAACYGWYLTNYPTYHVTKDGGVLCQSCLSKHAKEVMEATDGNNQQWEYAGTDINHEDTSLHCDHCEKRIPSAYCDDEEE